MIVFVGAIVIGATGAFFSDTETSTGNTFTAGAIDLTVDNTQHYNNAVCVNGLWALENPDGATNPQYPVIGSACGGTWALKNLVPTSDKFFNFGDIKPGDSGEDTISLHVLNNDAWVCANVSNLTNNDNGLTEPEALVDQTGENGEGELGSTMNWTVWKDDGSNTGGVACDNIQQPGEPTLTSGHPTNGTLALYDSQTGNGPLVGGPTGGLTCLGVSWSLPAASGNETQTDSLTGDISFNVVQSRNNANYVCGQTQTEPTTFTLNLQNKDANWQEITNDGMYGTLTFKTSYPTFDYSLAVNGLNPSTSYILLYYADPWPSTNGMQIGSPFTTDASGNASVSDNVDLNKDLPVAADANYPTGAKLWVIPASQWNGTQMTAWTPLQYLHEHELIHYDDTNN